MNLLDPAWYPWDQKATEYEEPLVPSKLSFLRRMKEDLVDHEGNPLFPPRFSETVPVELKADEAVAYDAVMDYVESFYADNATLARSIYGKRAASGLHAVSETLVRREAALRGAANGRATPMIHEDLITSEGLGDAADDDEAWSTAEDAVISARTKDKTAEITQVSGLLELLADAQAKTPAKWMALLAIIDKHSIRPGSGQLLVFTEFTDTARWLFKRFDDVGFSTGILEGGINNQDRDTLQERFLAGEFQVLVSTDAGGEGIDLQSAHVMVDWDLPWSMVRLEQRMGRLHRVGQTKAVHVYHLVAPHTKEGRVQEVMLANLDAASASLSGKLYDLLDATAARAGFDWGRAMIDAQAGRHVEIPTAEALIASAKSLVAEERSLATPANITDALERFAADRLESINPVIVDAMLDQLARSSGWKLGPGAGRGIRTVQAPPGQLLPRSLGGGTRAEIASDGSSVRQAINDGAGLDSVIVLGPTEEAFQDLVMHALAAGESDLVRGASLVDASSLTSYVLALFDADVQAHDGSGRGTHKAPLLIRCSGGQAIPVAWESLLRLRASQQEDPPAQGPTALSPSVKHDAAAAARRELRAQVDALTTERRKWMAAARTQLDTTGYRFEESIADRPVQERAEMLSQFERNKAARIATLDDIAAVTASGVRLVGWVTVTGGARSDTLGYDPDAETVAITTVVSELERMEYDVDDRQTAGVGYDLYARHRRTREQRLVEVKGLHDGLRPLWLEQNEWAQAQQRGREYWLYVVDSCATTPTIRLRLRDPAAALNAPRRIERFQIPMKDLSRLIGENT